MTFYAKKFSQLTTEELYEILKSRAEIFLLEQGIVCQDMDDIDYECMHYFFTSGKRVIAYLRAFVSNKENNIVTIGRVITLEHKKGLGTELMKKSIADIIERFTPSKIAVHAQKQATGFYEKMGFVPVTGEYLEEGIVHITMELE